MAPPTWRTEEGRGQGPRATTGSSSLPAPTSVERKRSSITSRCTGLESRVASGWTWQSRKCNSFFRIPATTAPSHPTPRSEATTCSSTQASSPTTESTSTIKRKRSLRHRSLPTLAKSRPTHSTPKKATRATSTSHQCSSSSTHSNWTRSYPWTTRPTTR